MALTQGGPMPPARIGPGMAPPPNLKPGLDWNTLLQHLQFLQQHMGGGPSAAGTNGVQLGGGSWHDKLFGVGGPTPNPPLQDGPNPGGGYIDGGGPPRGDLFGPPTSIGPLHPAVHQAIVNLLGGQ